VQRITASTLQPASASEAISGDHESAPLGTHFAFVRLLRECLTLRSNESLLLVSDESFAPFQESFEQALTELEAFATQVFLPTALQERWTSVSRAQPADSALRLPDGLSQVLFGADTVLSVLGSHEHTLDIRKAILQHDRPAGCRFAHMPGISSKVLNTLAASPIPAIVSDSELMAWALGQANVATIFSKSRLRPELRLDIQLHNWDNAPIMSPGVIFPGSWGNVLPGETFCCPRHPHIEGEICINGSIPGRTLGPTEEVHLRFAEGRLVEWSAPGGGGAGATYFNRLAAEALVSGDSNWCAFAELGFGLNPIISSLTGNALFDEKAAGTIHVAIGDNTVFGHPIHARIHLDLVVTSPTVILDDLPVIVDGVLRRDAIRFRRAAFTPGPAPLSDSSVILLRKANYAIAEEEMRRCNRIGGRVSLIQMAPEAPGRALRQLERELDTYREVVVSDFVQRNPAFEGFSTRLLLDMLYHYRAIAIGRV
jgi:hypothetical protein